MALAAEILRTMRPHQWAKNSFVLAPLVFSKHLFDPLYAAKAAAATAAFCILSGAVYAINDVADADADRNHPIKKNRPIASGRLPERTALIAAGILATVSLALCAYLSSGLAIVGAVYLAQNLAYSLRLKQIAYVDVLLIATGFLLRVAGGAYAIDVPMSPWLLACTGLLAALLGLGKRAHELVQAQKSEQATDTTRAALAGYSLVTLQWAISLLAIGTSVGYALYTRDPRTVQFFGTERLIWTLPFCIVGILRFVQLTLWTPRPQSPTDAMLRDIPFVANILMWGMCVLYIIYG